MGQKALRTGSQIEKASLASTLGLGAVRTDDCTLNTTFGSRFPLENGEGTLADLWRGRNELDVS